MHEHFVYYEITFLCYHIPIKNINILEKAGHSLGVFLSLWCCTAHEGLIKRFFL